MSPTHWPILLYQMIGYETEKNILFIRKDQTEICLDRNEICKINTDGEKIVTEIFLLVLVFLKK